MKKFVSSYSFFVILDRSRQKSFLIWTQTHTDVHRLKTGPCLIINYIFD